MIPPETLRQIRRIHIKTGRLVTEGMAGEYVSVFKGRGMEFEEVRAYQPGDDVRTIDWNVTARQGQPFVKEFREERELTVVLMVDISASGRFGTTEKMKNEVAAEVAAALAFAAIRNNDKVGLILFTDRIERFLPPRKGRGHVWRVIREIINTEAEGRGTDIEEALGFLRRVIKRRAVVFLLSDFLDEGWSRALRVARRRHDLIALTIRDPRERELPAVGFIELEDAETGEWMLVDTYDPEVRRRYKLAGEERDQRITGELKRTGVDRIALSTDEGYVHPLLNFFRMRERRIR